MTAVLLARFRAVPRTVSSLWLNFSAIEPGLETDPKGSGVCGVTPGTSAEASRSAQASRYRSGGRNLQVSWRSLRVHVLWALAQKGLAFRSKSSMCVVVARVTLPRATRSRPDVLNRPGLVSVRGLDRPGLHRDERPAHVRQAYSQPARSA
jgi:hypothetical protein